MMPAREEIELAAFRRWEMRGRVHGAHEDDWLASEQALLFHHNYRVIYEYNSAITADAGWVLGQSDRPVCRFCEQAAPRTQFAGSVLALADCFGIFGLWTNDQCLECRESFDPIAKGPLSVFVNACRVGAALHSIPLAAYRGMVRSCLAILPTELLDLFPDALEWVNHTEVEPDDLSIARMGIVAHFAEGHTQPEWAAVARKHNPHEPMPNLIAFLGTATVTFQVPLPLCLRDDDLSELPLSVPRVPRLDGLTRFAGHFATRRLHATHDNARHRIPVLSFEPGD